MEALPMSVHPRPPRNALVIVAAALALFFGALASESAQAKTIHLVALGDSLTAGYGLAPGEAYPSVLEKALKDKGWDVAIANAGVSGDTAEDGAARADWSVPDGTDGVLLELGANDALRGLPPKKAKAALERIIAGFGKRKIPVMLIGVYAPRNLGQDYVQAFDGIYSALAKEHELVFYPFFLDGVVGEAKLNLQDGMHPSAEGVRMVVRRMLPTVEQFLRTLQGGKE